MGAFESTKSTANPLQDALHNALLLGYDVSFKAVLNQFEITLKKGEKTMTQAMPLFDHFYESKIAGCIEWMGTQMSEDEETIQS